MSPEDFHSWFKGFSAAIDEVPSLYHWEKILKMSSKVKAAPTLTQEEYQRIQDEKRHEVMLEYLEKKEREV